MEKCQIVSAIRKVCCNDTYKLITTGAEALFNVKSLRAIFPSCTYTHPDNRFSIFLSFSNVTNGAFFICKKSTGTNSWRSSLLAVMR